MSTSATDGALMITTFTRGRHLAALRSTTREILKDSLSVRCGVEVPPVFDSQ